MKYFNPGNLHDLLTTIASLNSYTLLSGGTDLVPRYQQGRSLPKNLVDIKYIKDLRGIREFDDHISIGPLTTIEEIKTSHIIQMHFPALWQSTIDFAGVQIRNRATIGGNIGNASPAGDTLPPLYALEADLQLETSKSKRTISINSLISGPGKTDLHPGEIVRSIHIPKNGYASLFEKVGLRGAMAISVANVAVVYSFNTTTKEFEHLNIAAGAVAPTVVMLTEYSKSLMHEGSIHDAAQNLINNDINPINDIRGTGKYRSKILKNILHYHINQITVQRI
ncbi:MAG: FAD binding domain-containing protein [Candidatus Neomarinimicrobiota bacterium]